MPWMKISLSQDQVASGYMGQIQNAFAAIFMSNGGPRDAAMFARSRIDAKLCADNFEAEDEEGEDDKDYQSLYFSPAAAELASGLISRYGGVPCKQPGRSALLVGQQDAFRLLKGFKA